MAKVKKVGGLGLGLAALIPDQSEHRESLGLSQEPAAQKIRLEYIQVNPYQPRRSFDEGAIGELAESIALHGVLQPVLVRSQEGRYQLIAGERRLRAARIAGLEEIPAVVFTITDREMMEVSLIENIQRQDLDPVEEARAYKRLSDEFGQTQDKIAKRVSKSRAYIANSMRLLRLPGPVLDWLAQGVLSVGHVRPLLVLGEEDALALAGRIVAEKATAREAELWAKLSASPAEQGGRGISANPDEPAGAGASALEPNLTDGGTLTVPKKALAVELAEIQQILRDFVKTKVEIIPGGKAGAGGRIVIEYYTQDDIERILELLAGRRILG